LIATSVRGRTTSHFPTDFPIQRRSKLFPTHSLENETLLFHRHSPTRNRGCYKLNLPSPRLWWTFQRVRGGVSTRRVLRGKSLTPPPPPPPPPVWFELLLIYREPLVSRPTLNERTFRYLGSLSYYGLSLFLPELPPLNSLRSSVLRWSSIPADLETRENKPAHSRRAYSERLSHGKVSLPPQGFCSILKAPKNRVVGYKRVRRWSGLDRGLG
jgi:hypothetical protein